MRAASRARRGRAGLAIIAGVLGGLVGAAATGYLNNRSLPGLPGAKNVVRPYTQVVHQGGNPAAGQTVVEAVRIVGPAVVNIDTLAVQELTGMERYFSPEGQEVRQGKGSGFVINGEQGYVVTNNHVIEGAREIKVTLPDKRSFQSVRVLGRDPYGDIAVLQINGAKGLPEAKLGDSDRLLPGETVVAMGNPFGFENTVTTGVVSATGRTLEPNRQQGESGPPLENLIQTDAAINPGNSGGALVDLNGLVVGMNTAIYARGTGLGFAVAVNSIKRAVADILRHGKVRRPYLGVGMYDLPMEAVRELGLPVTEGVLIVRLYEDGPAAQAGMNRFDVITEMAGQKTRRPEDVRRILRGAEVGQQVTLKGYRGKEAKTWKVRLGEMPMPG